MRQLKERITHNFGLAPLVRDDISHYLDFRMRAAGYRGPSVFSPAALKMIAQSSLGLTRRINILADKALLAAFSTGSHQIGPKEIQAAIRDCEFSEATYGGKAAKNGNPRPWLLPPCLASAYWPASLISPYRAGTTVPQAAISPQAPATEPLAPPAPPTPAKLPHPSNPSPPSLPPALPRPLRHRHRPQRRPAARSASARRPVRRPRCRNNRPHLPPKPETRRKRRRQTWPADHGAAGSGTRLAETIARRSLVHPVVRDGRKPACRSREPAAQTVVQRGGNGQGPCLLLRTERQAPLRRDIRELRVGRRGICGDARPAADAAGEQALPPPGGTSSLGCWIKSTVQVSQQ
jgi:hypothetical protein